jgi:outer membrane protein OmpA-like peptidoglycan-associated protein
MVNKIFGVALVATMAMVPMSLAGEAFAQAPPADPQTGGQDTQGTTGQGGPAEVIIYFAPGSSELDENARARLDELGAWAGNDNTRQITVDAEAGYMGSPDFDPETARVRARAIESYLKLGGITDARITAVAAGEQISELTAGPNTVRRVVLFTTGEDQAAAALEAERQALEAERQALEAELAAAPPATGAEVEELEEPVEEQVEPQVEDLAMQEVPVYEAPPQYEETVVVDTGKPDWIRTASGMSILVGGGVVGFWESATNDVAGTGGSWEARLVYGTRSPLALELAYIGTAQGTDIAGLDSGAALISNGGEAVLRINFLTGAVQPYVFGGGGWSVYDIVNADFNVANINDSDGVFQVPFGAGMAFMGRGFVFDVRGTGRLAYDDEIFSDLGGFDQDFGLNTWNVTGRLGWEF